MKSLVDVRLKSGTAEGAFVKLKETTRYSKAPNGVRKIVLYLSPSRIRNRWHAARVFQESVRAS
jgi:hypothetical protein